MSAGISGGDPPRDQSREFAREACSSRGFGDSHLFGENGLP